MSGNLLYLFDFFRDIGYVSSSGAPLIMDSAGLVEGGVVMLFSLLSLLDPKAPTDGQKTCRQCGQCCAFFGGHLQASPHDLRRWREHGRTDLLERVNRLGWIWVDPDSKTLVSPCPFIDRSDPEHVRCVIYEERPDMCRDYPTLAHGKRCLQGVFLSGWSAICYNILPEWLFIVDNLPSAA